MPKALSDETSQGWVVAADWCLRAKEHRHSRGWCAAKSVVWSSRLPNLKVLKRRMCSPLSGPHTKKALPSCACSVGRVWQMPNMRMKRATKRSFTCERTKALWNWAEVFYLFLVYHRVFVAQKHDSLGLGQHVRGPMTDLQGDASHGGANKRTTTRHWRYLSPAEKMSLHHL